MAKRPCRGCMVALVERGYCPACEKKSPAKVSEAARPSAAMRGYGRRWQATSKARLAKHPLCVDPFGDHGVRVVAAEVTDHIQAHKGDMALFWQPGNWQSLCRACNSKKAAKEEGAFGHRG